MTEIGSTRRIAYAAVIGALTAAGAYLSIPLPFSPVPITGQTFFILLAGLLLGSRLGAFSAGVYLLLGVAGLPVFAGGGSGIGSFFGPSGGFLIGFPVAAAVTGLFSDAASQREHAIPLRVAGVVVGSLVIYGIGVPWLSFVAEMGLTGAVSAGMLPFLPGDAVKAAAAVSVVETVRRSLGIQVPIDDRA